MKPASSFRVRAPGGLAAWTALVLLFVLGPLAAVLLVSLTRHDYMSFPDTGLTLRWYRALAGRPDLLHAAWQSLWLAAASSTLALAMGLPAAWALSRRRDRWAATLRTGLMTPLFVPMVLSGLAILSVYADLGWSDRASRLLVAHTVLTLPYAVRTLGASIAALDPSQALAARNLGAGPWAGFVHVTLPQLRPGLFAAGAFAFIVSFDNVGLSLFLAGPGSSTLPVALFTYASYNNDPTVAAASIIMVLASLLAVVAVERVTGLQRLLRGGGSSISSLRSQT